MNILLAGVGGQGIVLASRILAECAILKGDAARTAETIGMAQRGGSVMSHVRNGQFVNSPLIPYGKADLIIAFEAAEAVRALPYLSKDGAVLVNNLEIPTSTASYDLDAVISYIEKLPVRNTVIDGVALCRRCGSSKVLNVAILGVAAYLGYIVWNYDDLKKAVDSIVPEKFRELNEKALNEGYTFLG
ncbi:MAG: indolepyruvate oxidoreductase subunit beta [Dehalococcoidales bacterium]|jgi:indolepyruvate ferredoxin oxidoreductase beta subunit|nr:indolepyruvate oxidoreductase subunit beta [Dehalococcoidales bacterium]